MDLKLVFILVNLFTIYSFVFAEENNKCGENIGECPSEQCCNNGECTKNDDLCLVSKGCQMKYGSCIDECAEFIRNINEDYNYGFSCLSNEEGRLSYIYLRWGVELSDIDKTQNVTSMKLREPDLNQETVNALSNFENLTKLTMQEPVFFKNTNYDPLKKLTKLSYLNIYDGVEDNHNHVKDVICLFPSLKELIVNQNHVMTTVSDCISNLKNLEKLDFSNNEISTISNNIGKLKNLKELNLRGNNIKTIPDSILKLENLEVLDLTYNPIKEIPEKLCQLKNLKKLYVDETNENGVSTKIIIPKQCCTKFDLCNSNESEELPISTNDKCGKEFGKCPSGKCCSKYGWCGTSDDHCSVSKGCQSEFGQCNNNSEIPVSTNNKCGKEYGKCPSGKCCSKYGWCGTSDEYCSVTKGCQSEFGQCKSESTPVIPISTNSKCGKEYGKCPNNQCCSPYGWCGKDNAYCGKGCQSKFGRCD